MMSRGSCLSFSVYTRDSLAEETGDEGLNRGLPDVHYSPSPGGLATYAKIRIYAFYRHGYLISSLPAPIMSLTYTCKATSSRF